MEYKERLLLNALEESQSAQRSLLKALKEYMETSAKDIGYAELPPGTAQGIAYDKGTTSLYKELTQEPGTGAASSGGGEVWPRPTVFTSINKGQSWDVEKAAQAAADERAPLDLTFPIKF